MSDEPLIHVVRESPEWATGIAITECGNASKPGDMDIEEMKRHVRTKHRGSVQRAYSDSCVTCIQTAGRHGNREHTEAASRLVTHLTRLPARRFPDEIKRRNAEVEAIGRLIENHGDEFRALVDAFVGGLRVVGSTEELNNQ